MAPESLCCAAAQLVPLHALYNMTTKTLPRATSDSTDHDDGLQKVCVVTFRVSDCHLKAWSTFMVKS